MTDSKFTKSEPKVYKLEGEAFQRIKAAKDKQMALVNAAKAGEKKMQSAIFKEIGITDGERGNPLIFDEQYEATGVYFLRELRHPLQDIMEKITHPISDDVCPLCNVVHGEDDVTKH